MNPNLPDIKGTLFFCEKGTKRSYNKKKDLGRRGTGTLTRKRVQIGEHCSGELYRGRNLINAHEEWAQPMQKKRKKKKEIGKGYVYRQFLSIYGEVPATTGILQNVKTKDPRRGTDAAHCEFLRRVPTPATDNLYYRRKKTDTAQETRDSGECKKEKLFGSTRLGK